MATKKKTFTEDLNNPALGFLSDPEKTEPAKAEINRELTEEQLNRLKEYAERIGFKLKPEGKTRRVQIVMTDSLFEAAKNKIEGVINPITGRQLSFNQYVSNLIQADIDSTTHKE